MKGKLAQKNFGAVGAMAPTLLSLKTRGGLNWSGVDPPLSSSRACLTTFIAFSVP